MGFDDILEIGNLDCIQRCDVFCRLNVRVWGAGGRGRGMCFLQGGWSSNYYLGEDSYIVGRSPSMFGCQVR